MDEIRAIHPPVPVYLICYNDFQTSAPFFTLYIGQSVIYLRMWKGLFNPYIEIDE